MVYRHLPHRDLPGHRLAHLQQGNDKLPRRFRSSARERAFGAGRLGTETPAFPSEWDGNKGAPSACQRG